MTLILCNLANISWIISLFSSLFLSCTQSEYTGTQAEETEPQTEVIVTVHADDADETSINSVITYVITGESISKEITLFNTANIDNVLLYIECINCGGETLFEINSTSGEVTNTKKLVRLWTAIG